MNGGLEVDGLAVDVTTDRGRVRAVDEISFDVRADECVALVGESGSGKTLTARAVLGLLPPGATTAAGRVRWRGRDLGEMDGRRRRALLGTELAYVSQEPALDPVMRVGRQLVEAMRAHGAATVAARQRAPDLLGAVGIADASRRARAYPHQLSGGMRQRVALALALANDPDLVIADEPTTALDVITQAQVLDLLAGLRARPGRSLLLITHDLGVVAGVADRVLVMYAGRIVEEGRADDIFSRPRHPYTAALLGAVPRIGDRRGTLPSISGSAPDPSERPRGCPFHPRCAYAEPACETTTPPLEEVDPGGRVACIRAEVLGPLPAREVRA